MGRKVARGSREKSAVVSVGGDDRSRPSPNPSRLREGSKAALVNPLMPGLRIREDGWTVARTRVFLATLGRTGCVADAARVSGVSTTSVNRSRKLFAAFDKACRDALARALRGLEAVAYERAVAGREMVVIRDGREVERRIVPSDALLAMLIKRGDLSGTFGREMTPEEAEAFVLPEAVRHRFIDRAEYERGIMFEGGVKRQRHIATQEETDAALIKCIEKVTHYRQHQRRLQGLCIECGQPVMLSEVEWDAHERAKAEQGQLPPPRD